MNIFYDVIQWVVAKLPTVVAALICRSGFESLPLSSFSLKPFWSPLQLSLLHNSTSSLCRHGVSSMFSCWDCSEKARSFYKYKNQSVKRSSSLRIIFYKTVEFLTLVLSGSFVTLLHFPPSLLDFSKSSPGFKFSFYGDISKKKLDHFLVQKQSCKFKSV